MDFSADFGLSQQTRDGGFDPAVAGRAGALRMPTSYVYEPGKRLIQVPDQRLARVLLTNDPPCASLSEYSEATGIDIDEVIALLTPHLDDQSLALEVAGDEVFLLTAPLGRPTKPQCADVAPNLWEHLRRHSGPEAAQDLWRLYRALERAHWHAEAQAERVTEGLSRLGDVPRLGVYVGQRVVPLLIYPVLDTLSMVNGLLSDYEQAGAAMVGVMCAEGALDQTVTAIRRWLLAHTRRRAYMSVVVLEAPRFTPVLLSSSDGAVVPLAVSQGALSDAVDAA